MVGQGAVGLEEFVADVENVNVGQRGYSERRERQMRYIAISTNGFKHEG